jgi:energy-coupling factor transporter ATP-binding protein EcfA2
LLARLDVERLRGFLQFRVDFSKFNLLVGRNNVGKSTLVDSLRMISLESNPYLQRDLIDLPERLFSQNTRGFLVPAERVPFDLRSVHHEYASKLSRITATFSDGVEVRFAFTPEDSPSCYMGILRDGIFLEQSKSIRQALQEVSLAVLPPVAELEPEEDLLNEKYVRYWFGSKRSPRHFRNTWYYDHEEFDDFRAMLQSTWPDSDILIPEVHDKLQMFFMEDRITREVAWAGQGMQVWLQLLTYLAKMRDYRTLVLDEPEIFLHSDVQRKLIGLLQGRATQVIVATHSVDIINETEPQSILTIDRRLSRASTLSNIEQVQRVVEGLGSVLNIQLVDLLRSRVAVFVEGDDGRLLRKFASKLGSAVQFGRTDLAFVALGGSTNWEPLLHLNWYSKNTLGETLHSFLILDRDYKPESVVREMLDSLQRSGIEAHVWEKKELENYLLVPDAIQRAISTEIRRRHNTAQDLTTEQVVQFLRRACDSYRAKVHSQLLSQAILKKPSRREDHSTTIANFEAEFELNWRSDGFRLSRAPGKDLLSDLSRWAQAEFKVSLSADIIADSLMTKEVNSEIRDVISRILKLTLH